MWKGGIFKWPVWTERRVSVLLSEFLYFQSTPMHIKNLSEVSQLNETYYSWFPATKFTNILPAFLIMYSKTSKCLQRKTTGNTEIHKSHFRQLLLSPLLWDILSIRAWCVQIKRSFCAKSQIRWMRVSRVFGGGWGWGNILLKKAYNEKPASDLKYLVRLCKTER